MNYAVYQAALGQGFSVYVAFPVLIISFRQCRIVIVADVFPELQSFEAWDPSLKQALFWKSGSFGQKSIATVFFISVKGRS